MHARKLDNNEKKWFSVADVVKYLLKAKNTPEAVNTANDAGRTCLHISAIVNNLQLCKLLLDNNADKNSIMKNKVSKFNFMIFLNTFVCIYVIFF